MTEPSYAIAIAVKTALDTIPGVKSYSRVPSKTALPYIERGQDQVIGEDDAGNFFRAYVEVSVFAATTADMKKLVGEVHTALNKNLTLKDFTCHEFHYDGMTPRSIKTDGEQIEQGIMSFEYLVQAQP